MLEKIKQKAEKKNITNILYRTGDAARLPYPDNSFDLVFMVTVLGEVHDMDSCLKGIHRILKPKGIFSITEQKGDPDYIPLPKIAVIAAKHGFVLSEKKTRLLSYSANFKAKPFK
jgi:ubiquinone/menaquinone biosynthesis C-methylase UbiE